MKVRALAAATAAIVCVPLVANAGFFLNTFDDATSAANFNVTQIAGSVDIITFGDNYAARGIPEAPSTPGFATLGRGLFIAANKPAPPASSGAINGINVTPAVGGVSINFTETDLRLSFDMWMNVGPTLTGTTEQALFGINTDGVGVNSRTGATQTGADGVWYHAANEGGYGNTSTVPNSRDNVNYIDNTVVGRLDNGEAPFPALFPSGPLVGAPGNSWVRVVVEEVGGNVRMSMNGTTIFDVVNSGPTSGSVFIGYQDPFSGSIPAERDLCFVVFDNIMVTPEPGSLGALGILGALALRRRQRGN
jgi:hypothetical protein